MLFFLSKERSIERHGGPLAIDRDCGAPRSSYTSGGGHVKPSQLAMICMTVIACAESGGSEQTSDPATGAPVMVYESNTALTVVPLSNASCAGNRRVDPAFEVYDSQEAFSAAFKAIRPDLSTPVVDFSRFVVVGAFLGQLVGCGTQVTIAFAINQDDRVDVEVRTTRPATPCPNDLSSSSPYAFAQVDRTDKPYVRVEQLVDGVCP
jgi:hypothetical protein